MKKLCAVLLLIAMAVPLMAQDNVQQKGKGMGMQMRGDGACPGCGMMMGSMMQKSMVATEDGGVIIMAGNQLMKYDKDLKLVKEAGIRVDVQKMHNDMMKMKEGCPMSGNQSHTDGKGQ